MINPRNLIDENQPIGKILKQLDSLGAIDQNAAIREAKRIGAVKQQRWTGRFDGLKAQLMGGAGAADPPGMARTPGSRSWPDAPTVDFNGAPPRSSAPDRIFDQAFAPPAATDSLTVLRDRLLSGDRPQDVYGPARRGAPLATARPTWPTTPAWQAVLPRRPR
ncbi:MAG TPA: hypothetical protein PKA64_26295 [Myxococcota bacterium]|nr:hypothetical protein [Myxococcota bacterium]